MPSILITAFESYDVWTENSSWLALAEFARELPSAPRIVTRRYPVNLQSMRERLTRDLAENFDYALHLGQAPGSASIRLEAIGINVGGSSRDMSEDFRSLVVDGPVAYRSQLPLAHWAKSLRHAGVPATVSYHAGTFLCNATLYLSHYLAEQKQKTTQSAFIHLPLATSQVVDSGKELPTLSTAQAAAAIRVIVDELARRQPPDAPSLV